MTPNEARCYASVLARWTASTGQVAKDADVDEQTAAITLLRLSERGKVQAFEGCKLWRAWMLTKRGKTKGALVPAGLPPRGDISRREVTERLPQPLLPPLRSGSGSSLTTSGRSDASARVRPVSKASLLAAEQEVLADEGLRWSPHAIVGRFIRRWELAYGIDYKPEKSYAVDVTAAEALLTSEGVALGVACVDAMFDAELDWVKNKTIGFIADPGKRARFVRTVAARLSRTVSAAPGSGAGFVHIPD